MTTQPDNLIERTALRYGPLTAGGLVLFFFLMRMIGLVHNLELRALNLLIMTAGVVLAVRSFHRQKRRRVLYGKALGCGLLTAAVAAASFALFTFFYLSVLDTAFMEEVIRDEPFGRYLNPFTVSLTILLEGSFSGFLISYIALQYMKGTMVEPSYANE
ncbi:MAG: DUF4199 domain-containing protein [Catalinimonas sp.]